MTISTYGELRAAVANYTHRIDLQDGGVNAARVPEFISLAEKRIDRVLAKMGGGEIVTTNALATVAGTETIDLPSDFNAMRYLATTGSQTVEIKYRTPEVMYREWSNDSRGLPRLFTIHGTTSTSDDALQARLRPIPDAIYGLLAYYYKKVTPLVVSGLGDAATNWMLTHNPDVYIYACCVEAAGWIRDDAMLASFANGFARAVDDITENDDDRRVASASPRASPNFRMIKGM